MSISQKNVGQFIDGVAGQKRTTGAVAGRLIEESTELCLAAGLSAGDILAHVTDALHNQAIKATHKTGQTVFPSETTDSLNSLPEECADVSLVLKDLAYVANIDLHQQEQTKWEKFIKKQFRVSEQGTVYAVKPHINK